MLQLSRAFKAETGKPIGRFVDEATMERAHRMLTMTAFPIGVIANQLGFASTVTFARSYRRIAGVSCQEAISATIEATACYRNSAEPVISDIIGIAGIEAGSRGIP